MYIQKYTRGRILTHTRARAVGRVRSYINRRENRSNNFSALEYGYKSITAARLLPAGAVSSALSRPNIAHPPPVARSKAFTPPPTPRRHYSGAAGNDGDDYRERTLSGLFFEQ